MITSTSNQSFNPVNPDSDKSPLKQALNGVNILVTRPAHQAQALCDLITQAGGQALKFPLLAIADPQDIQPLHTIQQQIKQFDLIIFISPNAVYRSQHYLTLDPTTPRAAIGKSTAKALEAIGYPADIVPQQDFTSESLLALPALQQVQHHKILIVRGQGGRQQLAKKLQQRGAIVTYAEVYQRIKPDLNKQLLLSYWTQRHLNIIIITSKESLNNLLQLFDNHPPEWLQHMPLVVVSQRLFDYAIQYQLTPLLAPSAENHALLSTVQAWHQQRIS